MDRTLALEFVRVTEAAALKKWSFMWSWSQRCSGSISC